MGIQKIKLDYFLRKTKTGLKVFCDNNNLRNYDELLEYCLTKSFISVTKEEYKKVFPPVDLKEEKVEEKITEVFEVDKPVTENKTRKRRSRKKSSNQKGGSGDSKINS
jgi:hypothetical protein